MQYVVDVRPSETVDTLCVISHHTNPLMFTRQLVDNLLLGAVRILILINQHVLESLRIFPAHIFMLFKQPFKSEARNQIRVESLELRVEMK